MHDELENEELEEEHVHVYSSGPFRFDCTFCKGTGVHPATMKSLTHSPCPACQGSGVLEVEKNRDDCKPCLRCGSTGKDPEASSISVCKTCGGFGIV